MDAIAFKSFLGTLQHFKRLLSRFKILLSSLDPLDDISKKLPKCMCFPDQRRIARHIVGCTGGHPGAMQDLDWLGMIAQDAIEKRRAALGGPVINWKDILERCSLGVEMTAS